MAEGLLHVLIGLVVMAEASESESRWFMPRGITAIYGQLLQTASSVNIGGFYHVQSYTPEHLEIPDRLPICVPSTEPITLPHEVPDHPDRGHTRDEATWLLLPLGLSSTARNIPRAG
ncbi:hypothetical protein DFH29DRAFT_405025 [Suillus ampliporus]|nr:hypothetical protein DFH29DRAFT_405025 [Suillus ampliporus]